MTLLSTFLAIACLLHCTLAGPLAHHEQPADHLPVIGEQLDYNEAVGVAMTSLCGRLFEQPRRFRRLLTTSYRNCQCVDSLCAICQAPESLSEQTVSLPAEADRSESDSRDRLDVASSFVISAVEESCHLASAGGSVCNYTADALYGPACDCAEDDPDTVPLDNFSQHIDQCPLAGVENMLTLNSAPTIVSDFVFPTEDFSGSDAVFSFEETDESSGEARSAHSEEELSGSGSFSGDLSGDFSGGSVDNIFWLK